MTYIILVKNQGEDGKGFSDRGWGQKKIVEIIRITNI
jgi:hypothetical protein